MLELVTPSTRPLLTRVPDGHFLTIHDVVATHGFCHLHHIASVSIEFSCTQARPRHARIDMINYFLLHVDFTMSC